MEKLIINKNTVKYQYEGDIGYEDMKSFRKGTCKIESEKVIINIMKGFINAKFKDRNDKIYSEKRLLKTKKIILLYIKEIDVYIEKKYYNKYYGKKVFIGKNYITSIIDEVSNRMKCGEIGLQLKYMRKIGFYVRDDQRQLKLSPDDN